VLAMNRATGALELLCSEDVMVVGIGVVAGLSNQLWGAHAVDQRDALGKVSIATTG
jgi:hypothetical protein